MQDENLPDENSPEQPRSGLLGRISGFFSPRTLPSSRSELLEVMRSAQVKSFFDPDTLAILNGALEMSNLMVRDVMVPRSQVVAIDISEPKDEWLPRVVRHGHSRYPVVDGDLDFVRGISNAKDLLQLLTDPSYDPLAHLRPVRFVPETQPLDIFLRDCRTTRHHIALAVDEFGSISGLVTIDDVVEELIGEMEDESDSASSKRFNITKLDSTRWRVNAETYLDQFNEYFGSSISDDYCETVGGVVADRFERVPHKGEVIEVDGFRFKVLKGDEMQARIFLVEKIVEAGQPGSGDAPVSEGT